MSKRNSGFSLVEVCLALLVVGLGLVSVFGLFPSGLQSAKNAQDETREALFAEEVINGVRALAEVLDWNELKSTTLKIPCAAYTLWQTPASLDVDLNQSSLKTLKYISKTTENLNWAVRYKVNVEDADYSTDAVPAYSVRVEVWGGEFGGTNKVFYTEIFRAL